MTPVPDTDTFTLQDVQANMAFYDGVLTFDNLQLCIEYADNAKSPEYSPGVTWLEQYPNSLYGFRGYDHAPIAADSIVPSSSLITLGYYKFQSGSVTVNVTPDTMVTTSSETASWLSITAGASATGDFTLTVMTLSINDGFESRETTITITDGTVTAYVTARQLSQSI